MSQPSPRARESVTHLLLVATVASLALALAAWAQPAAGSPGRPAGEFARTADASAASPAICSVSGEEVRGALRRIVDHYQEVGAVAAVQSHDTLVISEAVGMADVEWQIPLSPDGRFQVASVAKALTAATLLRLLEQGRIDLDAPIQRYLPDFPAPETGKVTLRLLAGHLGGIRHYRDDEKTAGFLSKHFTSAREGIRLIGPDPYVSVPGEMFSYSSYGYNLIAAAIESVTRKPFATVLEAQVLRPLDLGATRIDDVRQAIRHRVRGYTYYYPWFSFSTGSSLLRVPDFDYSYNPGGGNLLSTASDLVRFGAALFAPGFLTDASRSLVTSPVRMDDVESEWSFGWRLEADEAGRRYLRAQGSNPGFQADLIVYPEHNLAIAVLKNSWGLRPDAGASPPAAHVWIADRCLPPGE